MSDAIAELPADLGRLVVGTTHLDVGIDEPANVVVVAVRAFFEARDPLREAAVAHQYAVSGRMTTGRAAQLADTRPGPAIEQLLRDHGVEPLVGPMSDEMAERIREQNRAVVSESSDGAGNTDTDRDSDTGALVGLLPADLRRLVRGAAGVDCGLASESAVIERALRWFYTAYESVREAALSATD